jgi:hypothetical protein
MTHFISQKFKDKKDRKWRGEKPSKKIKPLSRTEKQESLDMRPLNIQLFESKSPHQSTLLYTLRF